ncbi:MAG: rhodanese-like domain-containing protein [Nannocystaceae bacterium]
MLPLLVTMGACSHGVSTSPVPTDSQVVESSAVACEPWAQEAWMELSPGGTPEVDAHAVLEHPCWFRVVDVREPDELTGSLGVIDGIEHVPSRELAGEVAGWDREQPIVLVCRSGRRSGRLARELYERGITNVASLTGGMLAWQEQGLPVVSGREVPRWSPEGSQPVVMRPVTREDVVAHVADHERLRFTKAATLMMQGTQACVDGRDARAIVGTPGGDAGELVLALATAEASSGRSFDRDEIAAIFEAYLEAFGHFYMHSDDHALAALVDDLAHARPDEVLPGPDEHERAVALLRRPPAHLRDAVLQRVSDPRFVGCGHLRLMLEHPEEYSVRPQLVADVIEAYYLELWAGHPALDLVVLHGGHHESAVLEVRLHSPQVRAYSQIPLVSPRLGDTEVFVSHPQVADFVRRENASFLLEKVPLLRTAGIDEASFLDGLDALATRQARATLAHLADGLPRYTVRFDEGAFEVEGPEPDPRGNR